MTLEFKNREWQRSAEIDKIYYLLQSKLKDIDLILKHSSPPAIFKPVVYHEEGIEFEASYSLKEQEMITLYITMNRQIEIDLIFEKYLPDGRLLLRPVEARISAVVRSYRRVSVPESVVYASNFRVPKDGVVVGFGIKNSLTNLVIFEDFQKQNENHIPGLKIYNAFDDNLPCEIQSLKDTEKSIYIKDISSIEEVIDENSEFFNIKNAIVTDDKMKERISQLKDNKIVSMAVIPIISKLEDRSMICVGYISSQSNNNIDEVGLESMNELAHSILFRMAEANSVPIKVNQNVVNICRSGVALELKNEELKKSLLNKKKMIFDLVFAMQAPLRFQGDVCYMLDRGSSLITGVSFSGIGHTGSGKGNMRRLEKYIEIMGKAV